MITSIHTQRTTLSYRALSALLTVAFIFSVVVPPTPVYAQLFPQGLAGLPMPGTIVPLSPGYTPVMMTGMIVYPENPLEFDFIVGSGDDQLEGQALEDESIRLIKYFLAALTVPEQEMWVNLSPYEKDRIIPDGFGDTEMGRDLLAQDYLLKQLTASLMYPEDELGEKFWKRVRAKALEKFGTAEIPMNTFNKVWIVPEEAVVYEHGQSAFVIKSHLKVMLEEDYRAMAFHQNATAQSRASARDIALQNNLGVEKYGLDSVTGDDARVISGISSEVVREVLIPEIEKEINQGESFANLRQIYNSVILATWYKKNLKGGLLGQIYVGKNKTAGVDTTDKQANQKIYDQYLEAFQKGVYNYIREDYDPATREITPRKYFSGGSKISAADVIQVIEDGQPVNEQQLADIEKFIRQRPIHSGDKRYTLALVEIPDGKKADEVRIVVRPSITYTKEEAVAIAKELAEVYVEKNHISLFSKEEYPRTFDGSAIEVIKEDLRSNPDNVLIDGLTGAIATIGQVEQLMTERSFFVRVNVDPIGLRGKYSLSIWVFFDKSTASSPVQNSEPVKLSKQEQDLLDSAEEKIKAILDGQKNAGAITEEIYNKSLKNAFKNLKEWTESGDIYQLAPEIRQANLAAMREGRWDHIVEAYRQEIAFGTAGIRGKSALTKDELLKLSEDGPSAAILKGPNTINNFVLLHKTAGLIKLMKETGKKKIIIGFDSRIGGQQMAEMLARLFIAQSTDDHQFQLFLFDEASPFPELTFGITVGEIQADFGILISASHNPADYNGYKLTRENGAQLNQKMKDLVLNTVSRTSFSEISLADSIKDAKPGQVTWLGGKEKLEGKDYFGFDLLDMHTLHVNQVKKFIIENELVKRVGGDVNIGFAAFNGAGYKAGPRILRETGFTNLHIVSKLQELNGLFPAFKYGEQPDPGDPIAADIAVKEFIAEHGQEAFDAIDVLFGTDPDADRMGAVVKVPEDQQKYFGKYRLISANDAWTLLLWYRLARKKEKGLLQNPKNHAIVFSHVTTDALEAVGNHFNIKSVGEMLDKTGTEERGGYLNGRRTWVGFTYLGEIIERLEAQNKVAEIGAEESNGVSLGGHVKDKDGTLAAVLLAEVAAYAKANGTNLFEMLDEIYLEIGHYATANKPLPRVGSFEGAAGISEKIFIVQKTEEWMKQANARAATENPFTIAGKKVIGAVSWGSNRVDGLHYANVPDEGVRFFFEDPTLKKGDNFTNSKNYLTIRLSGTSQALRFYSQIFSNVDRGNIARQKAYNFYEAERVSLGAQTQILQEVGLDKYVPMTEEQLAALHESPMAQAVSSPVSNRELSDTASSPVKLSQFKFNAEVGDFINILLKGKDLDEGFLTLKTRHDFEYMNKGHVAGYLRDKFMRLVAEMENIDRVIIDGEARDINKGTGEYVIRVTSLEGEEKLVSGKNIGSSLEIYRKRDGNILDIVSSIHIRWGSSNRAVISDGITTQDYILMDGGNIAEVAKTGQDTNAMDINANTKDAIISIGEDTVNRPLFMKDFEAQILPTIKHKGRYAQAPTADLYKVLSEGIFMATWLSYGEAYGKAQAMHGAKGAAKIMTKSGLKDILSLPLTMEQLESNKQVYTYLGTQDMISKLETFLSNALPYHYTMGDLERAMPPRFQLPSIPKEETFAEYFNTQVNIPNTVGMDRNNLNMVKEKLFDLVESFREAFIKPIPLADVEPDGEQQAIIDFLRKEAPEVIFKIDQKEHLHDLKWLIRNVMEPVGSDAVGEMNPSGDVAKKLDVVFNSVLIYILRPQVHAIVSEEEKMVIYGVNQSIDTRDDYRIVVFLDPLDGSSAILTGESFGSIISFGFVKPGQNIGDGDFNVREQLISTIDARYGPSVNITFLNPMNNEGKPEVVQFAFTEGGELRKEFIFENLVSRELTNLTWKGLVPIADKRNPANTLIKMAFGGSTNTATARFMAMYKWLETTYGFMPTYGGALITDETDNSLSNMSGVKNPAGVLFTYVAQQDGRKKLRLIFEGEASGIRQKALGGIVTNGIEPILNITFDGQVLADIKTSYSSGSPWLINLEMAWNTYAERIAVESERADDAFEEFIDNYIVESEQFINGLAKYSQDPARETKTPDDIRRALLEWDSIDRGANYLPKMFNLPLKIAYQRLFPKIASSPVVESDQEVGGINLDLALIDLQIKRDGNGVPLPVNLQPIHTMRIDGFVPVIINVTPVVNLPLLMGFADTESPVNSADSSTQPFSEKLSLIEKYRNKYISESAYDESDKHV